MQHKTAFLKKRTATVLTVAMVMVVAMAAVGFAAEPSKDPLNIALASNGATVRVDSNYTSYGPEPLNDGYRHESFLSWSEIAWASSLQGDNHWVEITFPEVKEPKKVAVYWALDVGQYYSSQEVHLQVMTADGWKTVKTITPESRTPVSVIELDETVKTNAVRLFQEKNKGPVNYSHPNIMWISEIEVYE